MNRWVRKRKARGFTLVELLIVIVIIGILAGSMLLVFGTATDKAKATRVVSDMRSLKAAALMYYADENKWPSEYSDVVDYMDRSNAEGPDGITYDFENPTDVSTDCYVTANNIPTAGLAEYLADMAEESGVINGESLASDDVDVFTQGKTKAAMAVAK